MTNKSTPQLVTAVPIINQTGLIHRVQQPQGTGHSLRWCCCTAVPAMKTSCGSLPKAARVKIAVYNLRGQLIRQLKDEPQSSGSYTVSFEGHDLPAGIYLIRTQIGNQFHTGRILKL